MRAARQENDIVRSHCNFGKSNLLENFSNFIGKFLLALLSIEFWLGVFASALVGIVHTRMSRPKIRFAGGGGGRHTFQNGDKFRSARISLMNDPNFLWGLFKVKRDTLSVTGARIYNPNSRLYEGGSLWWTCDSENPASKIEIPVNESRDLFIYGVHNGRVHFYSGKDLNSINFAETMVELGAERFLEIHIFDAVGRAIRIPFRISTKERRNTFDGVDVEFRVKTTLNDRVMDFRTGIRSIINAFTRPNY